MFCFCLDENLQVTSEYWDATKIQVGTTWQQVSHTQVCPSGPQFVSVRLDNRDAGHTVWWDDLKLERIDNPIENPSFEGDVLGLPFTGAVSGTLELDATTARKGFSSLKHTATGADSYTTPYWGSADAALIPIQGSERAKLSVWAKGNGATPIQLYIFCLDENFEVIPGTASQSSFTATDNWKKFTHQTVGPPEARYFSIRLDNDGGDGSVVWWEDPVLEHSAADMTLTASLESGIGSSASYLPGDPIQVQLTARNDGRDDLGATRARVFLAQNRGGDGVRPVSGLTTGQTNMQMGEDPNMGSVGRPLDYAGGILLLEVDVPALVAGASHALTETLTLPEAVSEGDWNLLFVVDAMAWIDEIDESNNVKAVPISLGQKSGATVTLNFEGLANSTFIPTDFYAAQGVEMFQFVSLIAEDFGGTGSFCSISNGSPTVGYAPGPPVQRPIINVPIGFSSVSMIYAQSPVTQGGFRVWSELNGTGNSQDFLFTASSLNGEDGPCSYDDWFSIGTGSVQGKSIEFFENDIDQGGSYYLFDNIVIELQQAEIVVLDSLIEPREGEDDGFTFGIVLSDPIPIGQSVQISLERVSGSSSGEDMEVLGSDTVTFTSNNWNIEKPLTIWAPENNSNNVNDKVVFRLYKSGGPPSYLVEETQIEVTEIDDDFTFDAEPGEGGGLTVQPSVTNSYLDINDFDWFNIELTAVPDEGYEFAEWTVTVTADGPNVIIPDGEVFLPNSGMDNPTNIDNIVLNTEGSTGIGIRASFQEISMVTINVRHNGDGQTTVDGILVDHNRSIQVEEGTDIPIVANPTSGFLFTGWSSSPSGIIANPSAASTTLNTTVNATITANFAASLPTLTILNDGNGNTQPNGTQTVNAGQPVPITVTPASGFKFERWVTNSGSVSIREIDENQFEVTVSSDAVITAEFEALDEGTLLVIATNIDNPADVVELRETSGTSPTLNFIKEEMGPPHQYKLEFFREGDLPLTIPTVRIGGGHGYCLRPTATIDFGNCPTEVSLSDKPLPTQDQGNPPVLYLDFGSESGFPDDPNPNPGAYSDDFTFRETGNPQYQLIFYMEGRVTGSADVSQVEIDYSDPFPPQPLSNPGMLTLESVEAGTTHTYGFKICNRDTQNPFFADKNIDNENTGGFEIEQYGFSFEIEERLSVPPDSCPSQGLPFSIKLITKELPFGAEDVVYTGRVEMGSAPDNLFVFTLRAVSQATNTLVMVNALDAAGNVIQTPTNADGSVFEFPQLSDEVPAIQAFEVVNAGDEDIDLRGMVIDDDIINLCNIFVEQPPPSTVPIEDVGPFRIQMSGNEPDFCNADVVFEYREQPSGNWKTFRFGISGQVGDGYLGIDLDDIPLPPIDDIEFEIPPAPPPNNQATRTLEFRHTGPVGSPDLRIDVDPASLGLQFDVSQTRIVLAAGQTRSLDVTFISSAPGTFRGELKMTTNDPILKSISYGLVGTVSGSYTGPYCFCGGGISTFDLEVLNDGPVDGFAPRFQTQHGTLEFEATPVGQLRTRKLRVVNRESRDLHVYVGNIFDTHGLPGGGFSHNRSVGSFPNGPRIEIPPNQHRDITITYAPQREGDAWGRLVMNVTPEPPFTHLFQAIVYFHGSTDPVSLTLTDEDGVAIVPGTDTGFLPGNVAGESVTRRYHLTNNGLRRLTIRVPRLEDPQGTFSIDAPKGPMAPFSYNFINPGDTYAFEVTYQVEADGSHQTQISYIVSDLGETFNFDLSGEDPFRPTSLGGLVVDSGQIALSWTRGQQGGAFGTRLGHRIYRAEGNGPLEELATVGPNARQYNDFDVDPEITYHYEVTAYSAAMESRPSNRITFTTPPLPDLKVLNPGWFLSQFPSRYGFSGTLTNLANSPVNQNTKVKWYYSTNQTLGSGDVLLYTETEGWLGPNGSTPTYGYVNFADYQFGPGYILMVADGDNQVAESNEANNVTVIPNFNIPTFDGADLVVRSGASHRYVTPGGTVELFAEVENIGDDPTLNTSNLGIYIADNDPFDPPPPPQQTTLLKRVQYPILDAGQKVRQDPILVTIPAQTPPGEYELGYQADYDNDLQESDENNNLLRMRIFVQPVPPPPTSVNATDNLDNRIEVTWSAVPDADEYLVWRNTVNNPNTAELAETSLDTRHYFYVGFPAFANPNTTYYFWVQAKNESGTSGFSTVETGFIPDGTDPLGWIDTPPHNSSQNGVISIRGWALDTSRLNADNFSFTLDGNPITLQNFVYGTGRADVCDVHNDVRSPNCPMVGWKGDFNTAAFGNGTHVLRLIVTDDAGNQYSQDRTFIISN